jgi:peptide/nickel transport system substrate-binding protein
MEMKHWCSVICVIVVASLLAACGATPGPEATPQVVKETVKETVIVAGTAQVVEKEVTKIVEVPKVITATPEPGKQTALSRTLVVAVPFMPETIDPNLRSGGGLNNELPFNLYTWAVDKKVALVNGQLQYIGYDFMPWAAESLEWNADRSILTIHMIPGLVFANGDPVDKAALDWNVDRWFETTSVPLNALKSMGAGTREQVKVLDDTTIEIHFNPPNRLVENLLSTNCFGLINPNVAKLHTTADDPWAKDWLRVNAAGGGPYVLESVTADQVVLVKNEMYFEAPEKPWFEKVVYKLVPDSSTRLALLQAGEVDISYVLPLEAMPDLEKDPNLTVISVPSTEIAYLGMNAHMPPFDNVKVRQAINYAVPYDTIIKDVLLGYGIRMYNYVPEGMPLYDPTVPHYDTDYEKGKQLMAEAGYADGFKTELAIRAGVAKEEQAAVWIREGLSKIGIDVTVRAMPGAAFLEQERLRKLPFFLSTGWTSTANDAYNHFGWLVRSECCDYTDYQNAEIYKILDEYNLSNDTEARKAGATRIQQILYEEAPWVPLYQPNYTMVTGKDIKGLVVDTILNQTRLWYLYRSP